MTTKVSAKGQVVLLVQIQRKRFDPGDTLVLKIDGRRIILTEDSPANQGVVIDPVTGLPVLGRDRMLAR
jgi:hypothetical protein